MTVALGAGNAGEQFAFEAVAERLHCGGVGWRVDECRIGVGAGPAEIKVAMARSRAATRLDRAMSEDDKIISDLEARLPTLAGMAFAKARERMLAAGQSVLHSEQGVIYRVEPSGVTTPVMRIDPPVPVEKGRKITLR